MENSNQAGLRFDLLLKGGRTIDPANGVDSKMDVAIRGGQIAAVESTIPAALARAVADVSGLYVTPGLIDIHTHAYGYSGWTFPDEYAFPNGVTTAVDAGGSGYRSFEDFKHTIIDKAEVRLLALLNIVASGMLGPVEQDVSEMQAEPCALVARQYRDIIVGVKTAHFKGRGWHAVDGAVRAAELSDTVAMIDYSAHPDRSARELLLEHMRPGDIYTHMYSSNAAVLDANGRILEYVWEARKRGVLFDVGHGKGSFVFRVAGPCMDQGHLPDTISSDAHRRALLWSQAAIPSTMSKLINLGMSLNEAIEKATVAPARNIRRPELGTLSVGSEADVAVFRLEEGRFGNVDCEHSRLDGASRLVCHMTLRAGKVVWDPHGLTSQAWDAPRDPPG